MPIITATEYKLYAGMPAADASYDARLAVFIPSVQDDLEDAVGRKFDQTTYTDQLYNGKGERHMWLKNWPVTTLTAIKTIDLSGVSTTLVATDYRLGADSKRVSRISSITGDWNWDIGTQVFGISEQMGPNFPSGEANISVTYTAGYATGAAPAGLKLLMYQLIDAAMDNVRGNWTLSATSDGSESKTTLSAADYVAKRSALISAYRGAIV